MINNLTVAENIVKLKEREMCACAHMGMHMCFLTERTEERDG
jgi:hypothetical protein